MRKNNTLSVPFYNPKKTYQDNFDFGPFGQFTNNKQIVRKSPPASLFLQQKVYLPFGIPAGPLVNGKFVKAAFAKGFDLCVYKTVRTKTYPCHPWPNVLGVQIKGDLTLKKAQRELIARMEYKQPLSITNSFGVPSMDPDFWQEDMALAVKSAGVGQIMIGSFQGTKKKGGKFTDLVTDYQLAARLVKETGAKVLEANLSCPNEGTADLLCFDVPRVCLIAEAIKNEIGNTPLILKLAYFKDQKNLEDLVDQVGNIVDAFSVINTIVAPVINDHGEQALPGEGRLKSGICGSAIKWAGLEMTQRLFQLKKQNQHKFSIIGVGGVMRANDYFDYIDAGADAVMSATGAMWNPSLAEDVLNLNK